MAEIPGPSPGAKHSRWFWFGLVGLAVILVLGVIAQILIYRAEPILRARLSQSLSDRFHSRVEMGAFSVSLLKGFQITGKDLAIYPYNIASRDPVFSVRRFAFRTGYRSLFRSPLHIGHVRVEGLRINMPPKSQRRPSAAGEKSSGASPTPAIYVDEMVCVDTVLTLGTDKPGKLPTKFLIQNLDLHSVGPGQPMNFTAQLTNPKPQGQIESTGHFGPWNAEHLGSTPLDGNYSFRHADLSTFKGIAGMLSSDGSYRGTLDRIVVDGTTDTPDFQVRVSGHPVALHTDFHAIVDGTDGNTYLQPVKAHFGHTSLLAQGYVVRELGEPGRHTYLDVTIDQGRVEDVLRLAVRTEPPVMAGRLALHTKLDLPPGSEDVAHRLHLQGNFFVTDGRFSSDKIQRGVDELSRRSRRVAEFDSDPAQVSARSQLQGDFTLADASLQLPDLRFAVPGSTVRLNGVYSLDGARFQFAGTADMRATMSEMVGGWKGLLLMPFDHYLAKNGAGTEVPFKIDGTRSDPHFGLDFGRKQAARVPVSSTRARKSVGVGIGPRQ